MKQIKKLNLAELKRIYKTHVREDFSRGERRPYLSMEKMTNTGKYASYGYYDDDRLLAYACYILTENGMYALLDYFAVVPELRGHGTGSEFLQELEGALPAQNGVFIEAESPDSAKSYEEATLRRRRIHFYLSNGGVLTNTKCLLFGVDYNILYIGRPGIELSAKQLHRAVEDLYREIYRPFYSRLCKPYVPDENQ